MKVCVLLAVFLSSATASAFDLKGLVEKAAKDEKMQKQAKDLAVKGYEYFKGEKKDEEKTADQNLKPTPSSSATNQPLKGTE